MYNEKNPHLLPPAEGGSGNVGDIPPVMPADRVPSISRPVGSEVKVTSPHDAVLPMDGLPGRSGSEPQEGGEEAPAPKAAAKAPASKPDGEAPEVELRYFAREFDESSLPEAARPVFHEMRQELDRVLEQIPSMDVLNELAARAQAYDKIASDPAFERYLNSLAGDVGKSATPDGSDVEDDEILSNLDVDTKSAVQRLIDKAIESRVGPLMQDVWGQKARAEISSLEAKYGKAFTTALENGGISKTMQSKNLSAEDAFLYLRGQDALRRQDADRAATAARKAAATMEGPGSTRSNVAPMPRKVNTVQDAYRLAEEMMGRREI